MYLLLSFASISSISSITLVRAIVRAMVNLKTGIDPRSSHSFVAYFQTPDSSITVYIVQFRRRHRGKRLPIVVPVVCVTNAKPESWRSRWMSVICWEKDVVADPI
jgi:hypothetical protein